MNTPHTGITYSQRNGLRRYRENQRAIRYVAPMHRRSADVPAPETSWLTLIAGTVAVLMVWAAFALLVVGMLEAFAGLQP
jgi:hypothetical protein